MRRKASRRPSAGHRVGARQGGARGGSHELEASPWVPWPTAFWVLRGPGVVCLSELGPGCSGIHTQSQSPTGPPSWGDPVWEPEAPQRALRMANQGGKDTGGHVRPQELCPAWVSQQQADY